MKATPESPRMFESDLVDFFSRTHPAVVAVVFLPAAAGLFFHGLFHTPVSLLQSVALAFSGFVTWTLIEYWLHRTFFHWIPRGQWGDRMHFLVHGVHHTWPRDKYRLVMPPAVSVSMFFIFFGLFQLLVGPVNIFPFHAGFTVGYATYDLTHYYIHHYNPRSKYGLALKKHHMLHHFKDHGSRFGVSSRFWDRVFGTTGTL